MRSVYDQYCEENARNKRINLLASWLTSHNDMLHINVLIVLIVLDVIIVLIVLNNLDVISLL